MDNCNCQKIDILTPDPTPIGIDRATPVVNAVWGKITGTLSNQTDLYAALGVQTLTIPNTTLAQELEPNTLYTFESRTNDLTITLGTPIVGKASEYHLFLVAGSTAPTITWPTGISWNGGSAPTIAAGNTYEVSILDGVAAFIEVEP